MIRLLFVFPLLLTACQRSEPYDLAVHNAKVLQVETGEVQRDVSVYLSAGEIARITRRGPKLMARERIDARGKLLTPAFIDTHIHPISALAAGDYDAVPMNFAPDSLAFYRQKITDGYLPFGTATVLMMGHPDSWTDDILAWSRQPDPAQVDLYTCGGALATEDGNTYPGHLRLSGPEAAKKQVVDYHQQGIRHLKLYWRLREAEFRAVQRAGDSLGLRMFAHSGGFFDPGQLTISQAIRLGIRNFEHISILPCSVLDSTDWELVAQEFGTHFGEVEGDGNAIAMMYILETFRRADSEKGAAMLALIDEMAEAGCTISTTIGWVYKAFHETFFAPADLPGLSEAQRIRCEENFAILMKYVHLIHQRDIPIRLGSDTSPGGKLVLLEIMLLNRYGISAEDAFRIATVNGARALGIENSVGTILPQKRGNLILWETNPLEDIQNVGGGMTVIKDGEIFQKEAPLESPGDPTE